MQTLALTAKLSVCALHSQKLSETNNSNFSLMRNLSPPIPCKHLFDKF